MTDSPPELTEGAAAAPAAAATDQDPGASAGSPPATTGVKEPTSLLEAVQAATRKEAPAEGSPDSQPGQEGDQPAEDVAETLPADWEPTDDELKRYHSSTRGRIKELLRHRQEARDEIARLAPKVEKFDRIVQFAVDSRLSGQDLDNTFAIARLVKASETDPAAARQALEALTPIVMDLQRVAGALLPDDLSNEVRQGYITTERAREIAQLRSSGEAARRASELAAETANQQRAGAQAAAAQQVAATISEWERGWQASDPDYAAKAKAVLEKVELGFLKAQREGKPVATVDAALALARRAKDEVDAQFRTFRPQRRAIDPGPGVGAAAANTAPAPQSILDVVRMARGTA